MKIDFETILDIAASFGLDGEENSEFLRFVCPFRNMYHPNTDGDGGFVYAFSKETLLGKCWVCKDKSSLYSLILFSAVASGDDNKWQEAIKVADYFDVSDKRDPVSKTFDKLSKITSISGKTQKELESERLLVLQKDWFDSLEAIESLLVPYLEEERGLKDYGEWLVNNFHIKYDKFEGRVVIPRYNIFTNEYLGAEGRTIVGDTKKVKSYKGSKIHDSFLFSQDMRMRDATAFILVEGMMDVLRLTSFGEQFSHRDIVPIGVATTCLTKRQKEILQIFYKPVFILFDNDKPGKGGAMGVRKTLTSADVPLAKIVGLPSTVSDPAELNEGQYCSLIERIQLCLGSKK